MTQQASKHPAIVSVHADQTYGLMNAVVEVTCSHLCIWHGHATNSQHLTRGRHEMGTNCTILSREGREIYDPRHVVSVSYVRVDQPQVGNLARRMCCTSVQL